MFALCNVFFNFFNLGREVNQRDVRGDVREVQFQLFIYLFL